MTKPVVYGVVSPHSIYSWLLVFKDGSTAHIENCHNLATALRTAAEINYGWRDPPRRDETLRGKFFWPMVLFTPFPGSARLSDPRYHLTPAVDRWGYWGIRHSNGNFTRLCDVAGLDRRGSAWKGTRPSCEALIEDIRAGIKFYTLCTTTVLFAGEWEPEQPEPASKEASANKSTESEVWRLVLPEAVGVAVRALQVAGWKRCTGGAVAATGLYNWSPIVDAIINMPPVVGLGMTLFGYALASLVNSLNKDPHDNP